MEMKRFRNFNKMEKFHFSLVLVIRITLVIAIFLTLLEKNWLFVFLSILTFVLTFLPVIFERTYNVDLPEEFEIIILFFIYAGIFLGGPYDFYYKYWWWDSVLHGLGGIALGFAGFLILYVLYKGGKFKASPRTIALFAFCFAIAMGTLWEIFEFGVDYFLGYNMQKARYLGTPEMCNTWLGVRDTMLDLILDATGALIASIIGYVYLKKKGGGMFEFLINKFEKSNPHLFKKKR